MTVVVGGVGVRTEVGVGMGVGVELGVNGETGVREEFGVGVLTGVCVEVGVRMGRGAYVETRDVTAGWLACEEWWDSCSPLLLLVWCV